MAVFGTRFVITILSVIDDPVVELICRVTPAMSAANEPGIGEPVPTALLGEGHQKEAAFCFRLDPSQIFTTRR